MIDKTPRRIARMFDAIAGRYDTLNRVLSAGLDQRWRAAAVRSLRLTGTETVLDLCTGTADVALALTRAEPGAARVVGVDFAPAMLRHGQRKLAGAAVALVRADATLVPLREASVDAAAVAFGIRNVEHPELALAEIFRVVRPGGRIAILEFGMPQHPVIREIYTWYFRRMLPWIGQVVSGHDSAYRYLPASVGEFPAGEAFCRWLDRAGFVDTRARSLQFGIVYLYDGVRGRARPDA